jgi:D-amino-acid dehydrogenase
MSHQDPRSTVIVVGAGIIGLSVALQLQLSGHKVTLIDGGEPMEGCSAGNAGCLSEANIFPPATPDLLLKLPKLLFANDGPLIIKPSYMAAMLPWFWRAATSLRPKAYERVISTMAGLTALAVSSFAELTAASDATDLLSMRGLLVAFRTRAALEERARRIRIWERFGLSVSKLEAKEVLDLVPALHRDMAGGLLFSNSGHCINPRLLGLRYATRLREHGARFVKARVASVGMGPEGSVHAQTAAGAFVATQLVVCAGYESKPLLEGLGCRVPLAAERGYHLMLPNAGINMNLPVIFGEPYFAATPMSEGIRLAGTAEFARFGSPPDFRRASILLRQAQSYLPEIDGKDALSWTGTRPSFGDGMPAIGRLVTHPRVLYAFGHSHNGLTLSAVTARCIAALASGRRPPVSLESLSLERFC